MARTTNRAGGQDIPPLDASANTVAELANTNTAAPATGGDPVANPAHPRNRKPNPPTAGDK